MHRLKIAALAMFLAAPLGAQLTESPWAYTPSDVVFKSAGEPVLTIHADGRITASPKAKPDEAARAVLRSLENMLRAEDKCNK